MLDALGLAACCDELSEPDPTQSTEDDQHEFEEPSTQHSHDDVVVAPPFPYLPQELRARIFRPVWRARDAAVRIQAHVRGAIVREWGLPALLPEAEIHHDWRHYWAIYVARWEYHHVQLALSAGLSTMTLTIDDEMEEVD